MWFVSGLLLGLAIAVIACWWLIHQAIEKTRAAEQRARSSARLAELGTLTGGLAHEIKNPLSTIGLNLQLLRESVDQSELPEAERGRLSRRIASISAESDRLRDILEDFLAFAGRVRLDRREAELNNVLDELIDFYEPQANASGVQLRKQFDANVGVISIDPTLLKQALLNLLINATQAMVAARYSDQANGGGGDLILTTQALPAIPATRTRQSEPARVAIHVIDTGPGIPAEHHDQIFHPYFSTKKGGTGLGLAVTRRIIEEHGGEITVHSDDGKGTDFLIILPREVTVEATKSDGEDVASKK